MLNSAALPSLHPAAAVLLDVRATGELRATQVSMPEDVRRLLTDEPSLLHYVDTHAAASAARARSTWSLLGRTWEEGAG